MLEELALNNEALEDLKSHWCHKCGNPAYDQLKLADKFVDPKEFDKAE